MLNIKTLVVATLLTGIAAVSNAQAPAAVPAVKPAPVAAAAAPALAVVAAPAAATAANVPAAAPVAAPSKPAKVKKVRARKSATKPVDAVGK